VYIYVCIYVYIYTYMNMHSVGSRLQQEVALKIVDMGFDLKEEYLDTLSGYSLDAYLPFYRCAVEVDGEECVYLEDHAYV